MKEVGSTAIKFAFVQDSRKNRRLGSTVSEYLFRHLPVYVGLAGFRFGSTYLGIGTSLKYYIEKAGQYFDITPIRLTVSPMANNPFTTMYSTLNGGITATQTTILLTSGTTFVSLPGIILIDSEQIYYDTKITNTLSGIIRDIMELQQPHI